MTQRAQQLLATSDEQVDELIALITRLDEPALQRPCPGREKLGDGTVGAIIKHTADNYQRIAEFVSASDRMTSHGPSRPGGHRISRLLRTLGHQAPQHQEPSPGADGQGDHYALGDLEIATQLAATRDTLRRIGELTDTQLDAIPPKDSFRFCDGQRTLEQVLARLLKHQRHQLHALNAAVS